MRNPRAIENDFYIHVNVKTTKSPSTINPGPGMNKDHKDPILGPGNLEPANSVPRK